MMKRFYSSIVALALATALGAQSALSWAVKPDWSSGSIGLEVSVDFEAASLSMPTARSRAEEMVRREIPEIVGQAISGLALTHDTSLGEAIAKGAYDHGLGAELAPLVRKIDSTINPDLGTLVARYVLPMTALLERLAPRYVPIKPYRPLGFVPTKEYSGIVIVVAHGLPLRGTSRIVQLKPALYPRLFDEEMRLVYTKEFVLRDALVAQGILGYYTESDEAGLKARVGARPLYVFARELFGMSPTDIVISNEDARAILALDANRELLARARVAVLLEG